MMTLTSKIYGNSLRIFYGGTNIYAPHQENFSRIKVLSKAWYIPIALAFISLIGLLFYLPIKKFYKIRTITLKSKQDDIIKKTRYLVSGFNTSEKSSVDSI